MHGRSAARSKQRAAAARLRQKKGAACTRVAYPIDKSTILCFFRDTMCRVWRVHAGQKVAMIIRFIHPVSVLRSPDQLTSLFPPNNAFTGITRALLMPGVRRAAVGVVAPIRRVNIMAVYECFDVYLKWYNNPIYI
jgi:hypothetical protein